MLVVRSTTGAHVRRRNMLCTESHSPTYSTGFSCGARIAWAKVVDKAQEYDACCSVSNAYPQCAPCNPISCVVRQTSAPTTSGRAEPSAQPLTGYPTPAAPALPILPPSTSTPTVARVQPSTKPVAVVISPAPQAGTPILPGNASSTPSPVAPCPQYCNCWSCTNAWMNGANGFTCGQRIDWLIGT
jgi:hypothetical protein